jgi:hypothetical protein
MTGARSSGRKSQTSSRSARTSKKPQNRIWVERSKDGLTVYLRRAPAGHWDGRLDWTTGAAWLFRELQPGQGAYYILAPA